jgi:hypothetical protein
MYRRSGQDSVITSVGGTVMPNMLTDLDCLYLRHIMGMLVGVMQQADSTPITQDNYRLHLSSQRLWYVQQGKSY